MEKLSHDYVVCFCFAQTLNNTFVVSVNTVTKGGVSFLTINILKICLMTCSIWLKLVLVPCQYWSC